MSALGFDWGWQPNVRRVSVRAAGPEGLRLASQSNTQAIVITDTGIVGPDMTVENLTVQNTLTTDVLNATTATASELSTNALYLPLQGSDTDLGLNLDSQVVDRPRWGDVLADTQFAATEYVSMPLANIRNYSKLRVDGSMYITTTGNATTTLRLRDPPDLGISSFLPCFTISTALGFALEPGNEFARSVPSAPNQTIMWTAEIAQTGATSPMSCHTTASYPYDFSGTIYSGSVTTHARLAPDTTSLDIYADDLSTLFTGRFILRGFF